VTPGDAEPSPAEPPALPAGSRDVLPVEASELREIEAALRDRFLAWGYREVMTPVLEFAAVMDRAQEGGLGRAFRLFDESGRVLVLRPDLTIPVTRLIAGRLADHPGPVRVFYVARAFRPPRPGRAQPSELRQAGVELVGAPGPAADAEALALLVESLQAAGLAEPQVTVGDVWLIAAVLAGAGVPEEVAARMRRAAAERDLVEWRAEARALGLSGTATTLVEDLPRLRGGRELLARIAREVPDAAEECERLGVMLDLLDRHGIGGAVHLDLGVLRDRPYYSGIVVEAYAPGVGVPIAAGGRYDGLAARFGRPRPAVGFAIALDDLHRAVVAQRAEPSRLRPGVVLVGGMDDDLEVARAVRRAGVPVVALERGDPSGEGLAAADGWRFVARRSGGEFELHDTATGERAACRSLAEEIASRA
jgi:ATP phosphoribosyltransferase regulatory subunit